MPSIKLAISIYEAFGVNLNWLLVGEGDMLEKSISLECENEQMRAELADLQMQNRGLLRVLAELRGKIDRASNSPSQQTLFPAFSAKKDTLAGARV
jgi:hypothetical protein